MQPIEYDKDGNVVNINLAADAANDDWMRAGRLKQKADQGDKEAAKELEQLEQTGMIREG